MILTTNSVLQNSAIRHSVFLERLKKGEVDKIIRVMRKTNKELQANLKRRAENIATRGFDTSPRTTKRLKQMLKSNNAIIANGINSAGSSLKKSLNDIALTEVQFQKALFEKAVPPLGISYTLPSETALRQIIKDRPFQGKLYDDWFDDLSKSSQKSVTSAITQGFVQGETIAQISKRAKQALGVTTRQATTLVRTSMTHITTQAREMTYRENDEVVKGVQYLATLDARTTEICASLDGKVFKIDEGERPPQHHQCRSTTVPVLKSFKELGLPIKEFPASTRASMNGQVSESIKYPQWLKTQPVSVQNEMLGVGKAKLFRAGKLDISKFNGVGNRPFTLQQLKVKEGLAKPKPKVKSNPIFQKPIKPSPSFKDSDLPVKQSEAPAVPNPLKNRFYSSEQTTSEITRKLDALLESQYTTTDKLTSNYKRIKASLLNNGTNINVLTQEGRIVGASSYSVTKEGVRKLHHIGAMPTGQKGIGTEVMRHFVESSLDKIELFADTASKGFFRRIGFIEDVGIPNRMFASRNTVLDILEGMGDSGRVRPIFKSGIGRAQTTVQWKNSLSFAERGAFDSYTGSGYGQITRLQRGEKILPGVRDRLLKEIKELEGAHDRAPLFNGQVHRGTHELDPLTAKKWATKGNTIEWESFSSTSTKRDIAKNFGRDRTFTPGKSWVEFSIKNSTSGVDIRPLAITSLEQEILYKKGQSFRVISSVQEVSKNQISGWVVELEEIL